MFDNASQPGPPGTEPNNFGSLAGGDDEMFPKVDPFFGDPLDVPEMALDSALFEDEAPQEPVTAETAEEAIRIVRAKMAAVVSEFHEGRINRAQFEAIYNRYQEQRAVAESLLARDPDSKAWQQVLSSGATGYLRLQHKARIQSYVLYRNKTGQAIMSRGALAVDQEAFLLTIQKVRAMPDVTGENGSRAAKVKGHETWLVYVPGKHATAVSLYSNQPTQHQLDTNGELHAAFEAANSQRLDSGDFTTEDMALPQSALLEEL